MSSSDQYDSRYHIEFSTDEPGLLENVVTFGAATVVQKGADMVFGEGHGWYCKITDSVTDLWESRWGATKGEAQEAAFYHLKRKIDGFNEDNEKEKERQRRANEPQRERNPPTYVPSDDDNSGIGCIVKVVLAGIAVAAILWFIFALAIPLIVIDLALIALIVGIVQKNWSHFLFPLSIAGSVLVVADYNKGWFTKALATNVPFLARIVPVLLYINILAGLVAAYFLIKAFINKRNPPPEGAGEFTKRNLITMGCLLLVGALTVGLQMMVDSQRKHTLQSMTAVSPIIDSANILAPVKSEPDSKGAGQQITVSDQTLGQVEDFDDASSLATTMQFIQDKLNGIGSVSFTASSKNTANGGSSKNVFVYGFNKVVADQNQCLVSYRGNFAKDGSTFWGGNTWLGLREVQEIVVKPYTQYQTEINTSSGLANYVCTSTNPPVTVLQLIFSNGNKQLFLFTNATVAYRVAKAFTHAANICGAHDVIFSDRSTSVGRTPFIGVWNNVGWGGYDKVIVLGSPAKPRVHIWASRSPQDDDEGEEEAFWDGGTLITTFRRGNNTTLFRLTLDQSAKLQLNCQSTGDYNGDCETMHYSK
jgi:hypothetical protein